MCGRRKKIVRLRLFEFGGILLPFAQNAHRGQVV